MLQVYLKARPFTRLGDFWSGENGGFLVNCTSDFGAGFGNGWYATLSKTSRSCTIWDSFSCFWLSRQRTRGLSKASFHRRHSFLLLVYFLMNFLSQLENAFRHLGFLSKIVIIVLLKKHCRQNGKCGTIDRAKCGSINHMVLGYILVYSRLQRCLKSSTLKTLHNGSMNHRSDNW